MKAAYASLPIRSKQEDGKLVCQECGKLYKTSKYYQNHLESKHGSKLHTNSQRTDNTYQLRKKRRGRNCGSKEINAEVSFNSQVMHARVWTIPRFIALLQICTPYVLIKWKTRKSFKILFSRVNQGQHLQKSGAGDLPRIVRWMCQIVHDTVIMK